MSETGSTAGDVTPTRADPSNQADQEIADAIKQINEDEEEEEDDDAADDEYVVEAILDHHADFEDVR